MFPGKTFSKERSLLLIGQKLPDSYASCNGENFIVSKRVAFRVLALAVPDSVKTEITIAYPERALHYITLRIGYFNFRFTGSGTARAKSLNATRFETMKFSPLNDA